MDFYLERTLLAIDAATAGLDPAQLTAHPAGKWSPAEILEHLWLTFRRTADGLQRILQSDKLRGRPPTLRERVAVLLVVELGYMPSGGQVPDFALPTGGIPPEEVLPTIRADVARMDAAIAECERQFGTNSRIANHPVLGPLTAAQWRKFHWVHTRHHMKQIAARRRQMA